jgi:DNA adenine methylase
MTQGSLDLAGATPRPPPAGQLLKWIGNKQRFAAGILAAFPKNYGMYHEPFIGSGAVLATLAPQRAVAGDVLKPLVQLWQAVQQRPDEVNGWYAQRWHQVMDGDKVAAYKAIRASFNADPNPADLLFLSRSCYGGVIRFARDGSMNTPCGAHRPIRPEAFAKRLADWSPRFAGTRFVHADFQELMDAAQPGDLVYCDPPYADSEITLYGAQKFSLQRLFETIERCRDRGVHVALSIDGTKRSGDRVCDVPIPQGIFAQEAVVDVGRSMLRRFQMQGQTLESERVSDRLFLTWP